SGVHHGESGRRGGDAGPAHPGESAGAIHLVLKPDPSAVDGVLLSGKRRRADGEEAAIARAVTLGESGAIELAARGGSGGAGGRGGRGGDGARGTSGSDATRYSSG